MKLDLNPYRNRSVLNIGREPTTKRKLKKERICKKWELENHSQKTNTRPTGGGGKLVNYHLLEKKEEKKKEKEKKKKRKKKRKR